MFRLVLGVIMGSADLLMALSYVADRQWRLALVWAAYAVAAAALATVNQR